MATIAKVQTTPFDSVQQAATKALAGFSPGAMQSSAAQQAAAMLHPQIVAQQNANLQQQQLYSNLYNRQTGFALAMGQLADPNGQQARNDYLSAAGVMGTLGQGITGAVGADWKNAAAQAAQTARGMTDQGQVQGLYDPTGLQSAGYTTGFALPGQSLADQGLVAAADARNRQLASANQLGTIAQNTLAQRAMAATQGQQALAGIQAQRPAIYEQALQAQRQQAQTAFGNLANITGQRAQYQQTAAQMAQSASQFQQSSAQQLGEFKTTQQQDAYKFAANLAQQAQQFGLNLAETSRVDTAQIQNQIQNTLIAQGYLGVNEKKMAGQIAAQAISNAAAQQSMGIQGRQAQIGFTGYDPVTRQLAPGYTLVGGRPVPWQTYAETLKFQAQMAMYATRGQADVARAASYRSTVASNAAKAVTAAALPGGALQTRQVPDYDASGKRIGSHQEAVAGTGVYDAKTNPSGQKPVDYNTVLQEITAMTGDPKKAIAIVNANPAYSKEGQNGRPFTGQNAVTAAQTYVSNNIKRGYTYQQILQGGMGLGIYPNSALVSALNSGFKLKTKQAQAAAMRRASAIANMNPSYMGNYAPIPGGTSYDPTTGAASGTVPDVFNQGVYGANPFGQAGANTALQNLLSGQGYNYFGAGAQLPPSVASPTGAPAAVGQSPFVAPQQDPFAQAGQNTALQGLWQPGMSPLVKGGK